MGGLDNFKYGTDMAGWCLRKCSQEACIGWPWWKTSEKSRSQAVKSTVKVISLGSSNSGNTLIHLFTFCYTWWLSSCYVTSCLLDIIDRVIKFLSFWCLQSVEVDRKSVDAYKIISVVISKRRLKNYKEMQNGRATYFRKGDQGRSH